MTAGSNGDVKLEAYLSALDRALGLVPVSQRADIILEIKSHVLDARARTPETSTADLLSSLGAPEQVANRYLLERGLTPAKAPRAPAIKWLTLGFLGTVALCVFALLAVIWRFTPIIDVDEAQGRVRILGGLINVNADETQRRGLGGDDDGMMRSHGALDVDGATVQKIEVAFANGQLEVESRASTQFEWDCSVVAGTPDIAPTTVSGVLRLDLTAAALSKCRIVLPESMAARLSGTNGAVTAADPGATLEIELVNGRIAIDPAADRAYAYELSAARGTVAAFESSPDASAIRIRAAVENGDIERL